MSNGADRQRDGEWRPAPPSPLTADEAARPRVIRLLPWYTPVLTAAAGVVVGMLWRRWGIGYYPFPAVRYIVLVSGLIGLGPCLADRIMARRPPALRWALGTSIAFTVTAGRAAAVFARGRQYFMAGPIGYYILWSIPLAVHVAIALAVVAAPGALFGLLAGKPAWRWHMPFGGALLLGLFSAAGFYLSPVQWWFPVWDGSCCGLLAGPDTANIAADPGRAIVCDAVLGLLLGLAFAVADWRAEEREAPA